MRKYLQSVNYNRNLIGNLGEKLNGVYFDPNDAPSIGSFMSDTPYTPEENQYMASVSLPRNVRALQLGLTTEFKDQLANACGQGPLLTAFNQRVEREAPILRQLISDSTQIEVPTEVVKEISKLKRPTIG